MDGENKLFIGNQRTALSFYTSQLIKPFLVSDMVLMLPMFPILFFSFLSFCHFLGCTRGIWRFPGQGSNRSCSQQPMPEPQHHQIRAASATYTTVHSNAGSLTHWVKPGIEPATSWFLVGFVKHCAMTGTPDSFSFAFLLFLLIEVWSLYTIIQVTSVQYSDAQYLKLLLHLL